METIMVTEKQKDNIVRELARLKKILEKDRGIDCVYFSFFAPYTREGGSALVITLVTDNFDSYLLIISAFIMENMLRTTIYIDLV